MKRSQLMILTSLALGAVFFSACSAAAVEIVQPEPDLQSATSPSAPQPPTAESTLEPTSQSPGRIIFEQLGISLQVPDALYVQKDPSVNLDDPSKLDSYLFYIQNYSPQEGPGEDYFQMYGHLQYNLPSLSWEDFASGQINSTMNVYANEIEVNGVRGFDTQLSGVRNRFVYHFFLDGRNLSIAISHPTEENKALADQIIQTLEFSPPLLTEKSGIQKIVDPNSYYQLYIPEDWTYAFAPQTGIRLSDLQASSPNLEVVVETSDGPDDDIYYKNGVALNVVVLEDDSATEAPVMALIRRSHPLMISGITGMDYIFQEPSTAEGELRELRYYHNGLSYLLRFGYAPDADQELINWIVRNFQIAP